MLFDMLFKDALLLYTEILENRLMVISGVLGYELPCDFS